MLKNIFISSAIALFIIWLQWTQPNPSFWFIVLPGLFLTAFYFFIRKNSLPIIIIAVMVALMIGWTVLHTGKLYFAIPLVITIVLFMCTTAYAQKWNQKVREAELRKKTVDDEKRLLEERYDVRLESLHHLETQVIGLVKLFEMTRDLNESLSFTSLLSVVDHKITQELSFARGTLMLVEPSEPSTEYIKNIYYHFGLEKRQDDIHIEELETSCHELITDINKTVKVESSDAPAAKHFANIDIVFPFWIFPLTIEHRLIAIMTIEGATAGDFPKYEILASQLALQVKKVKLYETVKEISIIDGLTGVFVRRHFLERFQEEMDRAIRYKFPLSVLMVDVDHFKSYNDKYGHLVGDKALKEVSQIIRENIRRVDVLGRYGGEEFIIAAPEIDKIKGVELAERIRSAIARKKFKLYDEETQVTVSIGVSAFPVDLDKEIIAEQSKAPITELINKSDHALYRAKEEGRNRVIAYN